MPESILLAGNGMTVMDYLTVTEVAGRLGVSANRVRVLIREERLPAKKFGTSYMILESDLKKVAVRRTGRPPLKKQRKAA